MSTARTALRVGLGPVVRSRLPRRQDLPPELWELSVDDDGRLVSGAFDLHALAQKWGSPLQVVQAPLLRRNAADYQSHPELEVMAHYGDNPLPGVLRILHGEGVGAAVSSHYGLWLALQLGLEPGRVVFGGPAKTDPALALAVERDVLINLNAPEELQRVATAARKRGKRARVGLRLGDDGERSGQLGVSRAQAMDVLRLLSGHPEVEFLGLHAHPFDDIADAQALSDFVEGVLAFETAAHRQLGLSPSILNFGGGLPCPSVRPLGERERRMNGRFLADLVAPDVGAALGPRDYATALVRQVRAHFQGQRRKLPRLVLEPGRGLTENAQLLLTRVVDTKGSSEGFDYAVLDAGVHLAAGVPRAYHQLYSANQPTAPLHRQYRLVGPSGLPADLLYAAWRLPRLRPGDTLAIMDTGAPFEFHAGAPALPAAAVVLLDGASETRLQRTEKFEELAARAEDG